MKRIGIVGAGIIGKSHREAIDGNDQCCLAAVCDVVREKAEELAAGTAAKVYTDYKEMAAEVEMDAVWNLLANVCSQTILGRILGLFR